ncbi:hypothetical protein [Sphingosinicella terrae]|uniref:hypothetical protein n=1 Tax=Sphingosinicella terrae TaxID=2172047 RepID=UPI000E0D5B73|nr:hypothetical protein [Sphingosinicella terrae]
MAPFEPVDSQRSLPEGAEAQSGRAAIDPSLLWISTEACLPIGEVLVVAGGHFAVAVLVRDENDPLDGGVFMNSSCDFVPWPSHWMPLAELARIVPRQD